MNCWNTEETFIPNISLRLQLVIVLTDKHFLVCLTVPWSFPKRKKDPENQTIIEC